MQEDLLKGFKQEIIMLNNDYEGTVKAVLVSKKNPSQTTKAVLYVHGFADYFFNNQLADAYINAGYNFYALDLRKYGRSLMDHQHLNFCKNLSEYFEELDKAIAIIRDRDHHSQLVLNGHSTGGLTLSLYAHERRTNQTIDGLILNSPWFDINENWFTRTILIKLIMVMGKLFPYSKAPKGVDPNYGRSVHKDYFIDEKKQLAIYEEECWNFNTNWKSVNDAPAYNGFLRAIKKGQKKLQQGLAITCPVFLLCSDKKGLRSKDVKPYYFNSDCVLNPEHMTNYIKKITRNPKTVVIKNALHDIALSPKPIRETYFNEIKTWLEDTFDQN